MHLKQDIRDLIFGYFYFFFEGEERQREGIDNSSINTVSDLPGIVLVGNID